MIKLKNAAVFLLLLLITICVVVSPWVLSDYNDEKIMKKTFYWERAVQNSVKITDKQVARLYRNGEIRINYFGPLPFDDKNSGNPEIQGQMSSMLNGIFNNTMDAELSFENSFSYAYNSVLTMVEGHPIALNFVSACIKEQNAVIEIIYEEKTNTLIRLSCNLTGFADEKEAYLFIEKLVASLSEYCKTQLELSQGEYCFSAEVLDTNYNQTKQCVFDFWISQVDVYIMEEKMG